MDLTPHYLKYSRLGGDTVSDTAGSETASHSPTGFASFMLRVRYGKGNLYKSMIEKVNLIRVFGGKAEGALYC
jgi:hypothetical protein